MVLSRFSNSDHRSFISTSPLFSLGILCCPASLLAKGSDATQILLDGRKLLQGGLQILDDTGGQLFWRWQTIRPFKAAIFQRYYQLTRWSGWQKVRNPSPSCYPDPPAI